MGRSNTRILKQRNGDKMGLIELNTPAPDFTLVDHKGNQFSLSDLQNQKHIILVLNRGFV